MKNYLKPSVETVEFNTADIIRTSGSLKNGGNNGDFTGNNASSAWATPAANAAQPIDVFGE